MSVLLLPQTLTRSCVPVFCAAQPALVTHTLPDFKKPALHVKSHAPFTHMGDPLAGACEHVTPAQGSPMHVPFAHPLAQVVLLLV
jgi:hypothetical protein